jgi:predicted MFS family arabinose efflux permease
MEPVDTPRVEHTQVEEGPARKSSALGHRDFALLWSGQSVSLAGDGIFTVALALETLRIDDRASALSFVLAARLMPTVLLLLIGGVLVDRIPRRVAMLVSDLSRALVVGAVASLVAVHALHVDELVVMSLLFGTADALFYPASTAIVPELLPAELLVQGSALSSTSRSVAQMLIGPALGGLIVATVGTAWSFGIDGASFVVSASCLWAIRTRTRPTSERKSALSEAREGLRFCRSQPWLWASILGAGVANFAAFSPLGVLIPLLVRQVLHQGAFELGFVLAAGGLGGMVAALLLAKIGAPRLRITAMCLAWGLSGLSVIGFSFARNIVMVGLVQFAVFGLLVYGNVLWSPLMQQLVPRELIGRVSAVDWLVSLGLSPLGVLMAGLMAGLVGPRETFLVGGAVAALLPGVLLIPGVRDPERPRDPLKTSVVPGP